MLEQKRRPFTGKRLARIQLKPETKRATINEINSKHHKLLLQTQWSFNFGEYLKQQISKLMKVLEKVLIETLCLHFCKYSTILKEIQHIHFPTLKTLYLNGNSIKNLEGLVYTDIPLLQNLYLRDNYIVSLRAFRRCCFKLVKLQLSINKILFLDELWHYLNLTKLEELWLDRNPKCIITFSFVKSQTNFRNINRFYIGDWETINFDRQATFLRNLGVPNLKVISY